MNALYICRIYKFVPKSETISKHNTRSSCPTRSIRAEWMGSAYVSGSRPLDHNKLVKNRATISEVKTAQQKNITDNMANMIGNFSHPNARRIERNKISIGIVIRTNVIITSFGDGSLLCRDVFADAACRAVESRETNIDPTLPGSPLMTIARRGNPW